MTILGANHGVSGTGTRGAESVIDGGFEITAAGVVIDGVRIENGALAFGSFDAVHVSANNVTITNSVLQGAGAPDTFALETEAGANITGLTISNNLIDGWNDGVALQQGTAAVITGNTFQDMVNLALRLDGVTVATNVSANNFLNNSGPGGHIGVTVFEGDFDVGASSALTRWTPAAAGSASSPMTMRRRPSPAPSSATSCSTPASAARRRPSMVAPATIRSTAAPATIPWMAARASTDA